MSYVSKESLKLDIDYKEAVNPIGIFLVWPCTLGDYRMYKTPVDKFIEKNYSVVLFNPRAHGSSEGQPDYHRSFEDLREYLAVINPGNLPVTGIGHSGGAGALLKLGTVYPAAKRFFLVAPVLDSRRSLFYMYSRNTFHEFSTPLVSMAKEKQQVLDIINDKTWLDPAVFMEKKIEETLNALSGPFKIGTFLDRLFISGNINAENDLVANRENCSMILPENDNWYPQDVLRQLAAVNDIPVISSFGAPDHFFTKAWKNVWDYVLDVLVAFPKAA